MRHESGEVMREPRNTRNTRKNGEVESGGVDFNAEARCARDEVVGLPERSEPEGPQGAARGRDFSPHAKFAKYAKFFRSRFFPLLLCGLGVLCVRHNEDVGGYDRKLPFLSILSLSAPLREKKFAPLLPFLG